MRCASALALKAGWKFLAAILLVVGIAGAAFLLGGGKKPPAGMPTTVPKPLLPSVDLPGMSLVDLQRHLGRLDCAKGLQGSEDCFVDLPPADLQPDEGGRVTIFVRAMDGRVGQLIINGPAARLEPVLGQLFRHYGTSGQEGATPSPGNAACRRVAEWNLSGQSAVVRSCDRRATGDGKFLVIDMLADWYARAGSGS